MRRKAYRLPLLFVSLTMLVTLLGLPVLPVAARDALSGSGKSQPDGAPANSRAANEITFEDVQAAAAAALQGGALNPLMVTAPAAMAAPGATPHYFSHPNYANSPLPTVPAGSPAVFIGNTLGDRPYATDNAANVFVVLPNDLPAGMLAAFQTWNQADRGGSFAPSAGQSFHAYVLRPTPDGTPNTYQVAFDSGPLTVPALTTPGVSQVANFEVANIQVEQGDRLAFYGRGIPLTISTGVDEVYYPAPLIPSMDTTITVGVAPYAMLNQSRTYAFGAQVIDMSSQTTTVTGGIRKFVDGLPGLTSAGANNLGQYVSVATPDTTSYPGSDYYEIALVDYTKQMHSDLPPTRLRGYVQLSTNVVPGNQVALTYPDGSPILLPDGSPALAVEAPQYLGAAIVSEKDKPVRILFRNLLPTGEGGNLFLPVDTTVMGAGMTPTSHGTPDIAMGDPQNPMCSGADKAMMVPTGECYADNRATLHLHGGVSPWISDGTPHQWITPAGEATPYPQGVSVMPVPDMPVCEAATDGCMTFYYTNQQSARLMFYHDHAWGITRLNVYAGEAAPYIITDATEQSLIDRGLIPGADATIPLVIQDKTFVPNDLQLAQEDETWDTARWGGEGSLWVPHVYSPAQNPGDPSGVNQYGRWAYGPWFWPPTNSIDNGPIDNPYYDPNCNIDVVGWCEPALMPGTPYLSMGMESFNDTPVVNGTAYPTLTVDPKSYRFRILNGANDRFFNLSLYKAIDANGVLCDSNNPNPAPEITGVACTEVNLNADQVLAALSDPTGSFPTPVVGTEGPDWIDIATEGGFLPAPAVIPAHPTTWVTDPTVFNAGNVDLHSLLIAPAERHDVIIDFSKYAGQTLILYNDAPAAFPARDPRYDYYTGNPDLRDIGGAPSTLAGYGPNTRTVMQIKVADTGVTAQPFNLDALNAAFAHQADGSGVFESGQNPIIVGQSDYNSAYGTNFSVREGLGQIFDTSLNFKTIQGVSLSIPLKAKMIQDEMGEAFEQEYGRMSGYLGVETPNAQAGLQNMILHPFSYPPDEIIDAIELPAGVAIEPIATADDGTQIWKFTHNGVDTHPIHFHLYDVQLINRVGWDGVVRKPDASEIGWKDTVRVSPLEDTFVAMRPIVPNLPWDLPNSVRLLDPSMPEGAYLPGANSTQREAAGLPLMAFSPQGEPVDIINHYVNYGWEYVYHCHILSHEEMDMMHTQAVGVNPASPTNITWSRSSKSNRGTYTITWTDNSKNETGFVIERRVAGSNAAWQMVKTVPSATFGVVPFNKAANVGPITGEQLSFTTGRVGSRTLYEFRVYAINVVGDVWNYANPAFNQITMGGWPTLQVASIEGVANTVAAPSTLALSAVAKNNRTAKVTITWTDNALNETGFLIQRADNAAFTLGVTNVTVAANVTSLNLNATAKKTFYYRVLAFNDTVQSGWSNTASITTP